MAVTNAKSGIYRFDTGGGTVSGGQFVTYARWIAGAASGDQCVLSDGVGSIWFDSQADGADFIDIMPIYRVLQGLTVTTIDSGILYVYTR